MSIPKIIHQTWKDSCVPSSLRRTIRRNKSILFDFDYRLWTDDDNDQLIFDFFPQYFEVFQQLEFGVVKADIARIVYLYQYGGWYLDLDYQLVRRLDKFTDAGIVIPMCRGEPRQYGNSILGSVEKHQFWLFYLEHIFNGLNGLSSVDDIIAVTGPGALTDCVNRWQDSCEILTPERDFFHPSMEGFALIRYKFGFHDPRAIGFHRSVSSWRDNSWKKRMLTWLISE